MSINYPSDLTDAEWECLQPYLPALPRRGRPRSHSLRTVLNVIFYLLRTGCPWRYLPNTFPPWQTAFFHFRRWHLRGGWHGLFTALRVAERRRVGKDPHPSAAIMDAQSVKTVEESAGISGFAAHMCVKGRKRQAAGTLLVGSRFAILLGVGMNERGWEEYRRQEGTYAQSTAVHAHLVLRAGAL